MKRNIYALSLTIAAMCGNTVCFAQDTQATDTTTVVSSEISEVTELEQVEEAVRVTTADLFSNRDFKTDYDDAETFTTINLADDNTTVIGEGVSVDNNIISIRSEGTYVLNGTLSNGQIYINCDKAEKVQLVLDGVSITNNSAAPIYIDQADKVFITTNAGTTNNLNAVIPEDDETGVDAVIFSREDMTLNGEGSLSLTGVNANGITGKDEVRITSGSYTIVADKHGIEANDAVKIAGGIFDITAQKDGIQTDAGEDTTLGFIHVFDGNLNIKAQDDCFQSSGYITFEDGTFVLNAEDDAVNAGTDLTIYGGNYEISSVDDALHAEVHVVIHDGEIDIKTSYEGIEGQMIDIHGGNISMYCNDDGINASMGGDSTTTDMFGGGGGMRPQGGMMDMLPEELTNMLPVGELTSENMQAVMAQMQQAFGGQMGQQQGQQPQDGLQQMGQIPQGQQQGQVVQLDQQVQVQPQLDQQMMQPQGQQQMGQQGQGQAQVPQILGQTASSQDLVFPIQINSLEEATSLCEAISVDENAEAVDTRVYINITGGNIYIDSNSEGDGLDSNGDITISGGNLVISSTTDVRDTALDYNNTGIITGGSVIGAGSASRTVQNFGANSTQGSIVVVLDSITSGEFKLTDADGNVVASFNPPKDYQAILISNDDIVQGETYTLTTPLGEKSIKMESNTYTEGSSGDDRFSMRDNVSTGSTGSTEIKNEKKDMMMQMQTTQVQPQP